MTLLETKLYVQDLPPEHVARPELLRRLRSGLARRVTAITAPAGYGKSQALTEFFVSLQNRPSVRVSLDGGDDPPAAFWHLVGVALDRLAGVDSGDVAPSASWRDALVLRLNRMADLDGPRILALDDLHVLRDEETFRSLEFFVDHLPRCLHLILSGRGLGPLPLARWRARGDLWEIDQRELRFGPSEARSYLRSRLGKTLSDEEARELWLCCEGWPAVLHLAATSLERHLQQTPERDHMQVAGNFPDARPHDVAGGHREIAELFADEMLGRLDEPMRSRLVGLSVLETCCLELCESTLDEKLPADWLMRLEQAHLPVVRLDAAGRWWRFHHLFADFLRRRCSPHERRQAHLRASRWFEAKGTAEPAGYVEQAVSHALEAGNSQRALDLLGHHGNRLLESGRSLDLLRAVGRLGVPFADLDTPLLDRVAWASYMVHDDLRCRRAMARLDQRDAAGKLEDHYVASLLALRAILTRSRHGDLRRAVELFDAAKSRLSPATRPEDATLAFSIGCHLAIAQTFDGELDAAAEILEDLMLCIDSSKSLGLEDLGVVSTLAQVRAAQGRLRVAESLCRRTLDAEQARGRGEAPGHALLYRTLGRIHVQRGEWSEAESHLAQADATSKSAGFEELLAFSALWRGEMARCRGDDEAVDAAIELVDRLAATTPLAPLHHSWQRSLRLHRRLDEGDLAGAERLVRSVPPTGGSLTHIDELWQQARIRALHAQGRRADARHELDAAMSQARSQGRRELELALLAWKAWLTGQIETLLEALHMARDEGVVHAFLVLPRRDVGRLMDRLLSRSTLSRGVRQLAERIRSELAARPIEAAGTASDLTQKEREVLALIADGRSNQDIAAALGIAQTTVKTHVRHLFDKLGVRRRTQAVAEARAGGLL